MPALVSAFLVLMGFAWLIADPPGAYLDESAHYIKALGVAGGDYEGEPPAPTHAEAVAFLRKAARGDRSVAGLAKESRSPAARWQARTTRQFDIPRPLFPAGFGCTARGPEVTADCLDHPPPAPAGPALSASGTYQPYLFLPAGLVARTAGSPRTGVRLGRAALLAISLGLLVTAVWLLWDPRAPGTSLLGFVVAVRPSCCSSRPF